MTTLNEESAQLSPLGKKTSYICEYQPSLLFPIPRKINRAEMGIFEPLPFKGYDIWNGHELSWLNTKGKPVVALAEFIFPCDAPNIVEAKSFKLYLNSFNNTRFACVEDVIATLQKDLSHASDAQVKVSVTPIEKFTTEITNVLDGVCLDALDIECDTYLVTPAFLTTEKEKVSEVLFSNLLKSNCLVTGQPDWGSVQIIYSGEKINHAGLLKYIVSYRNHNEFNEQCIERIFTDVMRQCAPQMLTVRGRYTRRGGLDINPLRSTEVEKTFQNRRLCRQ